MIYYCTIVHFISASILSLMSLRLYFSYQKSKEENVKLFSLCFFYAAIHFLFTGLPGKLVEDLWLAEVIFILAWTPLFVSIFYLSCITLNIWELQRLKKILQSFTALLIIITTLVGFLYFSPASHRVYRQALFCLEGSPGWMLALNGTLISLFILVNSILFFHGGLKSEDRFVLKRSLLIGSGMALLSIAAFINFAVVPNTTEAGIFFFLPGGFLFIGVFLIYLSTQYKKKVNGD